MIEKDNHPAYKSAKENCDLKNEGILSKNDLVLAGVTTKIEKIKRSLCHAIDTNDEKLLEETLWEYYYEFSDSMSWYRQDEENEIDFQEKDIEEQKPFEQKESKKDIMKELMEGWEGENESQDIDLKFS